MTSITRHAHRGDPAMTACGHCGNPPRGHATVNRTPLCHPDAGPDCYRLVTVYHHPMPCPDCTARNLNMPTDIEETP